MAILPNDLRIGQTISMDQNLSTIPGCLLHTYGKEPASLKLTADTLFVDHCSKFIFFHNQVSLGAD